MPQTVGYSRVVDRSALQSLTYHVDSTEDLSFSFAAPSAQRPQPPLGQPPPCAVCRAWEPRRAVSYVFATARSSSSSPP
jgi:hypothetical protein